MIDPFVPDKIMWHQERITQWLGTGTTNPISWELDLTNRCNHKCPDCPGGRNDDEDLDLDSAKDYLFQINRFGGKSIVFTGGGEALMNPIAPEVMKFANYSLGLDVSLITNGSLLNEENVPIILKHCTWVRVSLDAGSPKAYKFTHGCGEKMFYKVLDNIRLLVEARARGNFGCTIGVAFLTAAKTKKDMLRFTKLSRSLGVDYVQFRPYWYDDTDVTKELARCKKLERDGFTVLKSANKYDHLREPRPYDMCYGHHFAGVINLHTLYLCCHFRGKEKYKLGDLRKTTLRDIWNSERRKQVYEEIDYSDCFPVCRCDRFNRVLWNRKENPPTHVNFV